MSLIIIWYFFVIIFGLGLGLEVLASFNITAYRSSHNRVSEQATRVSHGLFDGWRVAVIDASQVRSATRCPLPLPPPSGVLPPAQSYCDD